MKARAWRSAIGLMIPAFAAVGLAGCYGESGLELQLDNRTQSRQEVRVVVTFLADGREEANQSWSLAPGEHKVTKDFVRSHAKFHATYLLGNGTTGRLPVDRSGNSPAGLVLSMHDSGVTFGPMYY